MGKAVRVHLLIFANMNAVEWNRLVRNLLPFVWTWLGLSIVLLLPKGSTVLAVNALHTGFLDFLFRWLSVLGDATLALLLLFVVLRYPKKYLLIYVVGFVVHVLWVHLFKQWLSAGELRPYAFFYRSGDASLIQLVEGVKVRALDSFPSGHTATAFFLASFFAVLADRRWLTWLLLASALLVGLSRIYLVQHWFVDTFFGMVFGWISTAIAWGLVERQPRKWFMERWSWSSESKKNG